MRHGRQAAAVVAIAIKAIEHHNIHGPEEFMITIPFPRGQWRTAAGFADQVRAKVETHTGGDSSWLVTRCLECPPPRGQA